MSGSKHGTGFYTKARELAERGLDQKTVFSKLMSPTFTRAQVNALKQNVYQVFYALKRKKAGLRKKPVERASLKLTAQRLKFDGKSRKEAFNHLIGLGFNKDSVYKILVRVYGYLHPRKEEKPVESVCEEVKGERKLLMIEFCLVPSQDLGVLAGRYRKLWIESVEGDA